MNVVMTPDSKPLAADNSFEAARAQVDRIADRLRLDSATRELLRTPMREYHFVIPVRMDDGSRRLFRAVRVQHNDARGPFKGGIRFHPSASVDEIRALAMGMTWKTAVLDCSIDTARGAALGYDVLPGAAWLEQSVDVLIPAALEHQITDANVGRVHGCVKLVVEAANAPLTRAAERALEDRGVVVVPDVLANAGGVACSYFEQVQGGTHTYWRRERVFAKLDEALHSAFREVHSLAGMGGLSFRDAAYLIAIDRVAQACRARGWV